MTCAKEGHAGGRGGEGEGEKRGSKSMLFAPCDSQAAICNLRTPKKWLLFDIPYSSNI